MTRSGFVALAGRPNVGKSTLVNAVVGTKVAITSPRPQTTRRAVRGVASRSEWQMVLVDLPGVQRPRDALTGRMQGRVEHELEGCDVVLLVVDGEQGPGPGDRFIAHTLGAGRIPRVIAVNKVDRLNRGDTLHALETASALDPGAEVFAVSARTGAGVEALVTHVASLLAPGPFYYPVGLHSDQPRDRVLTELIREQVLRRTFQEVPHSVEVILEDIDEARAGRITLRAQIWVETESQKGILIGARGSMIKAIGSAARAELQRELGRRVHLDLSVRVRRRWRSDDSLLDRLGIE